MIVRLAGPARRQADRLDRWWRENRKDAADLFALELEAARQMIAASPELGTPYVERRGTLVRRVLLPKTQNHVYYDIDRENGVTMTRFFTRSMSALGPRRRRGRRELGRCPRTKPMSENAYQRG